MEVHTPTRLTPSRPSRVPLGELPLSNYITSSTTGASPILKPIRNNAKFLRTPSPSRARTPPHSSTKPINIRPHHAHVYHSPSTTLKKSLLVDSPSRQQRPQTPTTDDLTSFTAGRSRSDSATSTGSTSAPVLARKRDRVNPMEVAEARERAHQPIPGSPSPCKRIDTPHNQRQARHRRDSSTASLSAFIKSRNRASQDGLPSSSSGASLMSSSQEDAFSSDDEEDNEEDTEMVNVTPMKLIPSPKESGHNRALSSSRPVFTQSLNDIFGVNTSTDNGSLIIYQDPIPSDTATKKRRLSVDSNDKENITPPSSFGTKSGKKGTGGRLSLVASANDADSSVESVKN